MNHGSQMTLEENEALYSPELMTVYNSLLLGQLVPGPKEIQELVKLGYEVENLASMYGVCYTGHFRWVLLNLDLGVADPLADFQRGVSLNQDQPWVFAAKHARRAGKLV
jgi:hypothetical protein